LVNFALAGSGDAEMRSCLILIFLLVGLVSFAGCGEDAETDEETEDPIDQVKNGDIVVIVTDAESGKPIEGASVSIGDNVILTDADGGYTFQGIPFSDKIEVMVTADNYREYNTTISLDQLIASFDFGLAPVDSPTAEILDVLEQLSQDIEALDLNKIPSIQSYFSEDYVAANDPVDDLATFFAVGAGYISPDFNGIPDAVGKIVDRNDKIEFTFADPDVTFNEDTATVLMRFEVYAESKPNPPDPAKKWEIIVDARIDLRKEDDDWKIIYWRLIPPFLKFEEEPLE
jgi:hypothetical protein